jgi:hypothetical protein
MGTVLNPAEELDALRRALETSEQVVRDGGMIDLRDLDKQVEMLCAEIIKTEGPLRVQLLPELEKVIKVLDTLETGLRQLAPIPNLEAQNRLRARDAYGQNTTKGH